MAKYAGFEKRCPHKILWKYLIHVQPKAIDLDLYFLFILPSLTTNIDPAK